MALKKVKLTYLNTRSEAELIRYILASASIDYEDHRITGLQLKKLQASK